MINDENIPNVGTISDDIVQQITDEERGEDFARDYLKAGFLASAVDALFHARREAGLTQVQVANLLKVKPASVVRLEEDVDGSLPLRRYVETALACGVAPLDMTFVPISSLRDYVAENPKAPRTADVYDEWLKKKSGTKQVAQPIRIQFSCTVQLLQSDRWPNTNLLSQEQCDVEEIIPQNATWSDSLSTAGATNDDTVQIAKRQQQEQGKQNLTMTKPMLQAMVLSRLLIPSLSAA
jgi:DNA-binding XRE family transcriptional regulator